MDINLPVFEILVILFFGIGFKWLFRFLIVVAAAKVAAAAKNKAEAAVKGHIETLKRGEEER